MGETLLGTAIDWFGWTGKPVATVCLSLILRNFLS
jgi:hypothetical protein